jgi:hypothetical protein
MSSQSGSRRCTALTRAGQPCRAWAVAGSDRCAAHSGKVGAPKGNKNRETHGFYAKAVDNLETIDDVVKDALRRQTQLSQFIDQVVAEGKENIAEELIKLLALHGQNASRIGRLMRDRKIVDSDDVDRLLDLLGPALDELASELGIEL